MTSLLSCPFCDGKAILVQQIDTERPNVTWVACSECNAMTDDVIGEPKEEAARIATELWNKRPSVGRGNENQNMAPDK